jgi:hypothetical protein
LPSQETGFDLADFLHPARYPDNAIKGRASLTGEERARLTEIRDSLMECYVERGEVIEDGQEDWARELQAEIDALRTKRRKSRIG